MLYSKLELQVLGTVTVRWDGRLAPLPASKKTRALLGYLALSPGAHSRSSLCDLLWDGPADPRGALRWSLSRIRSVLEQDGIARVIADRDSVRLDLAGAVLDADAARAIAVDGVQQASAEDLERAASLFRGELLEGLDLTSSYNFHAWCMRERESIRALRVSVLRELTERGVGSEAGLLHAHSWVAVDPLSEPAHAAVMRRLTELSRPAEARAHFEVCEAMLSRELGAAPETLNRLARELRQGRATPSAIIGGSRSPEAERQFSGEAPLVGRDRELSQIARRIDAAARGEPNLLLLLGESGIGKTRLLAELIERVQNDGWQVLAARAFETESVRSYGIWLDLFARMEPASVSPELGAVLSPLPGGDDHLASGGIASRSRFFEAVVGALMRLQASAPVVLVFDDLQWLDEGSIALLHYVVRACVAPARIFIAGGIRPGELVDNLALVGFLRTIRRSPVVHRLDLTPLASAEVEALVQQVDSTVDASPVIEDSGGNPLVALELIRARGRGDASLPETITSLIQQRLELLDQESRDLLPWLAALGSRFRVDVLVASTGVSATTLARVLDVMEQRDVLRAADDGCYEFAHDLVRQSAYQQVSEPRRRVIHRQIAMALAGQGEVGAEIADQVALHAELGGELPLAAEACAVAGRRSLHLFAVEDATRLADRGLRLIDLLADEELISLRTNLLEVKLLASSERELPDQQALEAELTRVTVLAQTRGLAGQAARAFYLLSVLHENRGDSASAERASLRAAEVGRTGDGPTGARQLANSARCIVQLEGDVPRARELLRDAERLAGASAVEDAELHWGRGLLAHWDGHHDRAAAALEAALSIARVAKDRWRECSCLAWLAMVAFERGAIEVARERSQHLRDIAARMGEIGKGALGAGIEALCGLREGEPGAASAVEAAFASLRDADAKAHLAWALDQAALLDLADGSVERAAARAREALAAAEAVRRPCEVARSRSLLVDCALRGGDAVAAREWIAPMRSMLDRRDSLSSAVRHTVKAAIHRIDVYSNDTPT